jgi:phage terminase small subunit
VHSNLIANLRRVRELNEGGKSGIGGIVIATSTGYLAPNQFYLNVKSAMDQDLRLCRELGLTPSARTRINTVTEQKKPANAWETHRSTAGGR